MDGYIDDLVTSLPRDEFVTMFFEKLEFSEDFSIFCSKLEMGEFTAALKSLEVSIMWWTDLIYAVNHFPSLLLRRPPTIFKFCWVNWNSTILICRNWLVLSKISLVLDFRGILCVSVYVCVAVAVTGTDWFTFEWRQTDWPPFYINLNQLQFINNFSH